jgi:hypothetical protein
MHSIDCVRKFDSVRTLFVHAPGCFRCVLQTKATSQSRPIPNPIFTLQQLLTRKNGRVMTAKRATEKECSTEATRTCSTSLTILNQNTGSKRNAKHDSDTTMPRLLMHVTETTSNSFGKGRGSTWGPIAHEGVRLPRRVWHFVHAAVRAKHPLWRLALPVLRKRRPYTLHHRNAHRSDLRKAMRETHAAHRVGSN